MFIHPLYNTAFGIYANAAKLAENATRIANLTTSRYSIDSTSGIHVEADVSEADLPWISKGEAVPDFEKVQIPGPVQAREPGIFDFSEEFVQMRVAFYGYRANIAALKTQDSMIGSILDIIA